jgi:hypothetical protein
MRDRAWTVFVIAIMTTVIAMAVWGWVGFDRCVERGGRVHLHDRGRVVSVACMEPKP